MTYDFIDADDLGEIHAFTLNSFLARSGVNMFRSIFLVSILVLGCIFDVKLQGAYTENPTKLTQRTFHTILSMDDPWIVVFIEDLDSKKESDLIKLATSVAGLVQVGFVDMDDPDNDDLIDAKVSYVASYAY